LTTDREREAFVAWGLKRPEPYGATPMRAETKAYELGWCYDKDDGIAVEAWKARAALAHSTSPDADLCQCPTCGWQPILATPTEAALLKLIDYAVTDLIGGSRRSASEILHAFRTKPDNIGVDPFGAAQPVAAADDDEAGDERIPELMMERARNRALGAISNAQTALRATQPDEARELLEELYHLVKGESPAILNEDSGGDATLDLKISAFLSAEAARGE